MKIIIFGNGSFAKLMYHFLSNDTKHDVIAFCVDKEFLDNEKILNLPVISSEVIKDLYPPCNHHFLIAVGYSNMRLRKKLFEKIKSLDYKCINYIHSEAIVDKSTTLGENNIILAGTIIEPFVTISDNNIFWSSVNISHNVSINSHSFFASQSLIGGFTQIKDNCFLGFNSTVIQNLIIREESLIGANSILLKTTNKHSKYIGSPAKEISNHKNKGIKIL
jgi:sugar O-acyltransferase (sialic acid O-acetyltransferase NeuD family)